MLAWFLRLPVLAAFSYIAMSCGGMTHLSILSEFSLKLISVAIRAALLDDALIDHAAEIACGSSCSTTSSFSPHDIHSVVEMFGDLIGNLPIVKGAT